MAAKTKKIIFKNEWGGLLKNEDRLSSCCGAHLRKIPSYNSAWYDDLAQDAAGMGIILSDTDPTKALKEHEQLTEVKTRNGVLFFTTRHKE